MYAYGAQSVKCAVCNYVTDVPTCQLRLQAQTPAQRDAQQTGLPSQRTTVVVENPPSLDDEGNEVQNIAVGVKTEADV